MEHLGVILSVITTGLPFVAVATTFLVKLIKSMKLGREEKKKRLWSEFAQEAVGYAETLKGKSNGELMGETKKEIALNRIEAACIKAGVPFEPEKVAEVIENIIGFTKAVNKRDKDKEEAQNGADKIVVPQAYAPSAQSSTQSQPYPPTY